MAKPCRGPPRRAQHQQTRQDGHWGSCDHGSIFQTTQQACGGTHQNQNQIYSPEQYAVIPTATYSFACGVRWDSQAAHFTRRQRGGAGGKRRKRRRVGLLQPCTLRRCLREGRAHHGMTKPTCCYVDSFARYFDRQPPCWRPMRTLPTEQRPLLSCRCPCRRRPYRTDSTP